MNILNITQFTLWMTQHSHKMRIARKDCFEGDWNLRTESRDEPVATKVPFFTWTRIKHQFNVQCLMSSPYRYVTVQWEGSNIRGRRSNVQCLMSIPWVSSQGGTEMMHKILSPVRYFVNTSHDHSISIIWFSWPTDAWQKVWHKFILTNPTFEVQYLQTSNLRTSHLGVLD